MINDATDRIIDLIEADARFKGWDVRSFPDDPKRYTLANKRGAVLVGYNGRRFADPESTEPRYVKGIDFRLTVFNRNLRNDGAETDTVRALEALSDILDSQQAEGCTFWTEGDEFVAESEGVWMYQLRLAGRTHQRLDLPL